MIMTPTSWPFTCRPGADAFGRVVAPARRLDVAAGGDRGDGGGGEVGRVVVRCSGITQLEVNQRSIRGQLEVNQRLITTQLEVNQRSIRGELQPG